MAISGVNSTQGIDAELYNKKDSVNKATTEPEVSYLASDESDSVSFTTTGAVETTGTTAALNGSVSALEEQLSKLEAQRQKNYANISKIESKIEALIKEIDKKIDEASKKKDSAIKNYKDDCKAEVRKQTQKYITENTTGKGMTKDEFESNLRNAFPNEPNLADSMMALMQAESFSNQIEFFTSDLKTLIKNTQSVENQIVIVEAEYEAAKKAAEAAQNSTTSSGSSSNSSGASDPIGFNFNNENYELIVDDGAFDSTSDFLGADKQWAAMVELDTDKDGIVSLDEFKAGNIKAVNSKGSVQDLENIFGKDFSVNLNSYDTQGTYSGLETDKDDDKDGIFNQKLLGTFTANIKGQQVQGYNTLDDLDWLSKKFNLKIEGKNTPSASNNSSETGSSTSSSGAVAAKDGELNETLSQHWAKAEEYEEVAATKKQDIQEAYKELGLNTKEIQQLDEIISAEALFSVKDYYKQENIFMLDSLTVQDEEDDELNKDKSKVKTAA